MTSSNVVIVLSLYLYISGTVGEEFKFRGIQGCEINSKSPGYVNETSLVMTSFDCVRECGRSHWCESINVCPSADPEMLTCEQMTFKSNWTCETLSPAPDCCYVEKEVQQEVTTCYNGGTYVKEDETCLCIYGFTGDWCERYYYDCSEAYQTTQVYGGETWLTIQPKTSQRSFTVMCSGGYTYIESRSVHCDVIMFNRTWEELRKPIINSDCSYWLGLENIYLLTSQADYLLDIYMTDAGTFRGHPLYENFKVGDAASGHRLTYGNYDTHPLPADDAFAVDGPNGPNGHPFATMDRPDAGGCAISQNAAWWYGPACPDYNLHLPLGPGSAPKPAIWRHLGVDFELKSFSAQIITTW